MKLIIISFFLLNCSFAFTQTNNLSFNKDLKDTLVSKFNHGDYDGFYELGNSEWKRKAKKEDINGWLQYIFSMTGPVISSESFKNSEGYTYYKWTGTKKIMCFTLKTESVNAFDDFNFTFLNEPISPSEAKKISTDNLMKSSLDSAVNTITTSFMTYNKLVGVSIGILKNGEAHRYNYGTIEKGKQQLPKSSDIYELESITKIFTGILLAQAVVDKKINFQDDIRMYLDGNYPNLAYKSQPIRIVNLANHTSGLLHELPNLSKYTSSFDVLKMYDSYTDKKFFEDLHKVTIDTFPGINYQYSNVGVKLLGIILERVYKLSYKELVKRYITLPFGMKKTIPSYSISDTTGYMKGYDENGIVMPHNNFNMFGGSGSLLSNVDDMLSFMRQNIAEKNSVIKLSHQQTWCDSNHCIGLCWEIDENPKFGTVLSKDGGALGFRSYCVVIPKKQIGIIWLSNKSGLGDELGIMIEALLDATIKDN